MRRQNAHALGAACLLIGGLAAGPGSTLHSQEAPEARAHHRLVYHAGEERTYLLGGSTRRGDSYHYFDDLWTWDGTAWTRAGSLPFPRSSHDAAYDGGRNALILFGGGSGRTFAADGRLWELGGAGWSAASERHEGAAEPAVCYDRRRARLVGFGGWDSANRFSAATWEWTGNGFVDHEAAGPAPRAGHALVYDPVRGRCLLFGGRGADGHLADTWEWDGQEWRQVATTGPTARWFFGAATDEANRRIVIFGGNGPESEQDGQWALGDTWAWNGTAWELLTATGPPPRGSARLAFDGQGLILFGGRVRTADGFRDLDDTWRLVGRTWERMPPASTGTRNSTQRVVDASRAVEELLRLHHEQRAAHVLADAGLLTARFADSLVDVGRGRVGVHAPAAARERFAAYFAAARFLEWEDVRPPAVRVSPDGRWAEVVVQKRVRTIPRDTVGSKREDAAVFAWSSRWMRADSTWRLATITSTDRPAEDTSRAELADRVRAYEILRRAREAVGGDDAVARVATLRFSAEGAGPNGRFVTEVASARDGRVAFTQRFPGRAPWAAGVSLEGPWRLTPDGVVTDTLGAVLESAVAAHELHLLALAPEARYAWPRARPSEPVQGRELHVVRFTDRLGAAVDFLLDAASGRPAGFRSRATLMPPAPPDAR